MRCVPTRINDNTVMSKSQQRYVKHDIMIRIMYSTMLFLMHGFPVIVKKCHEEKRYLTELMMNNDDEREKLASITNQEQKHISQYIVQTGYTIKIPDEFMSIVRDGKTTTTQQ